MSDTATTIPATASDAAPDWDAIDADVVCPLCGYNLRGIMEPRCPECGYRYAWRELLEPQTHLQEYLFESRPERNVWSFFRTITADLRPARFWNSLSPTQRPSAKRLVLYWAIAAVPAVVMVIVHTALAPARWTEPTWSKNTLTGTISDLVIGLLNDQSYAYYPPVQHAVTALLLLGCLAWPWVTIAALLVFQQSMRQASVNRVHVLRCVVYGADVVFWIGWLSTAMLLNQLRTQRGFSLEPTGWLFFVLPAALAWMSWRLIVAYRQYLRFDRPVATVLAAQAIVVLAILAVAMSVTYWG
jgi:hypothetical protein